MRSDFWSLPYAARREIRRGESAAITAETRGRKVAELERELAEAKAAREAGLRAAFMAGRASCSGTDRHRADDAWETYCLRLNQGTTDQ